MVKSNPDPEASAQANIDEATIRLGELIEDEALAAGQDYSIDVSLNPNRSNDLARRMPRRTTGAQFASQRLVTPDNDVHTLEDMHDRSWYREMSSRGWHDPTQRPEYDPVHATAG